MWQNMYGKLVQDSGFAVQICISHMNTGSCMPIFVTYIFNFVVGVDRLSAWPIIGADIEHFTDYRYRPF